MSPPVAHHANQSRSPGRSTRARLSLAAAALTAVICGLLAAAATIPAAFADTIPTGYGGPIPAPPVPATARVITVGGMAGWQIALIAVGAALLAAAATLLLDRIRTAHQAASATRT